jgi:hypothetical protein
MKTEDTIIQNDWNEVIESAEKVLDENKNAFGI